MIDVAELFRESGQMCLFFHVVHRGGMCREPRLARCSRNMLRGHRASEHGHNGHKPDSATGHGPIRPIDVCDREPRSKGAGQTISVWAWRLNKINTTEQEQDLAHVQEREEEQEQEQDRIRPS